ncbi:MAG: hypothetical protein QNJ63_07220 [Calothrix sp. MO_192.B10]|nr:hypothetical protein [Calothrix sp. MO_192.B10]
MRVYHLLIGGVLVLLAPMGVNFIRPHLAQRNQSPSNSRTQTKNIVNNQTPISGNSNAWNGILGKTNIPKGWQVKACESNSSLLCVSANGKSLGTVAIDIYPLEKRADFQKILTNVGITSGVRSNDQNPQYQNKLLKALRSWVDAEYAVLPQKRQQSDGNVRPTRESISFAAQPQEVVKLGKLQGIRYGFVRFRQEGGVLEKHLRYVTFDGKAMYVINTAFASKNAIPGKFDKLENLVVFEPYLNSMVANLQLPKQESVVSNQNPK